jgi:hypothetical protein
MFPLLAACFPMTFSLCIPISLAILGICAVIWFTSRPKHRVSILVSAGLGACVLTLCWDGPDKWNILLSVSTFLAVIVALLLAVFHDEIQTLRHRPDIAVYVGDNLADLWDGRWWTRGTITNNGDRLAKRRRVKLLRIEGENYATERPNAYLKWEGGIPDFMTLYPGEHWIFDIGTRDLAVDTPPLLIDAYIGHNPVNRQLTPRQLPYRLVLAVYGDNIPSQQKIVTVRIRDAAGETEIL